MQVKTKGIVLRTINYSDNKLIVKIFTEKFGIQTFIMNKSLKNKNKSNVLQILNLAEIDYNQIPNKTLYNFSDIKIYYHYKHLHTDITKISIAQFLNEVLLKSLNDNEHYNTLLFQFLENVFIYFDICEEQFENFHIYFLLEFSKYLGFYPHTENALENGYFDLYNGRFYEFINNPEFSINKPLSNLLLNLCKLNIQEFTTIKINYIERKQLLNALIDYYKIHVDTFNELKSLSILESILQ